MPANSRKEEYKKVLTILNWRCWQGPSKTELIISASRQFVVLLVLFLFAYLREKDVNIYMVWFLVYYNVFLVVVECLPTHGANVPNDRRQ